MVAKTKKIDYLTIALSYCKERAEFSKGNAESPCYCEFTIKKSALTGEAAFEVYNLAFRQERCAFWVEVCLFYEELEMDKIENRVKSVIAYAFLAGRNQAKWLAKQLECAENDDVKAFFKFLEY